MSPEILKPYGPNVLVRRLAIDDKTEGGIVLPENALNKNLHCEVLKVGTGEVIGSTFVSPPCKPGDIVVIRQMDGRKATAIDKELLLVHQDLVEGQASEEPWTEYT